MFFPPNVNLQSLSAYLDPPSRAARGVPYTSKTPKIAAAGWSVDGKFSAMKYLGLQTQSI